MAVGLEELEAAEMVEEASRETLAAGASDFTHGVDEAIMAERAAVLSSIVGESGIDDLAEGVDAERLALQEPLLGQHLEQSPCGAPDCGGTNRILAVDAQPRDRGAASLRRTGRGLGSLQSGRAWFSDQCAT